jgi:hypothetical protein
LGVGEQVTLTFLGGHNATWTLTGGGKINGGTSPVPGQVSVVFTAPEEQAATCKIAAKCEEEGGNSSDITFQVVEPTGAVFKLIGYIPNQNNGLLQAGFAAGWYITPADVNFTEISTYEDEVPADLTGHYVALYPNGNPHRKTELTRLTHHSQDVGTYNPDVGDVVNTGFIARIGNPEKYSAGTLDGKIPWKYKLGNVDKRFAIVSQKENLTIDIGNGTATVIISKINLSKSNTVIIQP